MTNKKTILIATGIYPPDIGGPATYAKALEEEFRSLGFNVLVRYFRQEKGLPPILRHIFYFLKVCLVMSRVDYAIALDTFSVGLPTVLAGLIFRKKVIIRTGGDFLWETYVNRTKKSLILSSFYLKSPDFTSKEKIIFKLTKFALGGADKVVFSTDWQRNIWVPAYNLDFKKTKIIENFFNFQNFEEVESDFLVVAPRKYLWAGRDIFLKNTNFLKQAFANAKKENPDLDLEIITNLPQAKLFEKMKACDVVTVPSLSEISPNLVLEGLSLGKPFILSKETGYFEKLKGLGLFVDPLSIDEISKAILEMAKPEIYKNYRKAINNFNFSHSYREICLEFIDLFEEN
ncbi:MAG TPA: glycosyltransferase family 4 protein [Candidatus Paceibacterota bacterium]|nr:glycosyltransferase family 4 protein [Candidatus Paceibacterota bacterium]